MADLNKWIGMGRLTADPELKQTTSGVSVTQFSIACNRVPSKEGEQKADFINIVAWRNTAEFVARYFKKGRMICVVGKVQTRSYDASDGSKRYVTEIVADEVFFTGEKKEEQSDYNPYLPQKNQSAQKFEEVTDDNLPF